MKKIHWLAQAFMQTGAAIMAATGRGYRKGSMRRTGRPSYDWKAYKTGFGHLFPPLKGWDRREDKMENTHRGRFESKAMRSYRKGFGL